MSNLKGWTRSKMKKYLLYFFVKIACLDCKGAKCPFVVYTGKKTFNLINEFEEN